MMSEVRADVLRLPYGTSTSCGDDKYRVNNLRHQPGDMYIAATVTFVQIYNKIKESA